MDAEANIVTLTLPYTDRLNRADIKLQKGNKKWPYDAGRKLMMPAVLSGQEMAYDAVRIHEELLKEESIWNDSNYDNPAGAGIGIGRGSSPWASGMHPSWFKNWNDEFENASERYIKNWILKSMNRPIDGIRNGGAYMVNEQFLDEAILSDFLGRRKAIKALDERLQNFIVLNEKNKEDVATSYTMYDFTPFYKSTIKDFLKDVLIEFKMDKNALTYMSRQDFERVFINDDEDVFYKIFKLIIKKFPSINIILDDIKSGDMKEWHQFIFNKPYVEGTFLTLDATHDNDETFGDLDEQPEEEIEKPEQKKEETKKPEQKKEETKKPIVDKQIKKEFDAILIKYALDVPANWHLDKNEWKNTFEDILKHRFNFSLYSVTVGEFVKKVIDDIENSGKVSTDFNKANRNAIIFLMKDIYDFDAPYIMDVFFRLETKINSVKRLFDELPAGPEKSEIYTEYLNEAIGDKVNAALDKTAGIVNKATGAVASATGKAVKSVGNKIADKVEKIKLKHSKVFDQKLSQTISFADDAMEKEFNNTTVKNSRNDFRAAGFEPYPMSTVRDFYKKILMDFNLDKAKIATLDQLESFEEEYGKFGETVPKTIFNVFQALLNNNDIRKITDEIKVNGLKDWFPDIFEIRPAQEVGKPDVALPADEEVVEHGEETVVDNENFEKMQDAVAKQDVNPEELLRMLQDPKYSLIWKKIVAQAQEEEKQQIEAERAMSDMNFMSDVDRANFPEVKVDNILFNIGLVNKIVKAAADSNKFGLVWTGIKNGIIRAGSDRKNKEGQQLNAVISSQTYLKQVLDYWKKLKNTNESFEINNINMLNEAEQYIFAIGSVQFTQSKITQWVETAARTKGSAKFRNFLNVLCNVQVNALGVQNALRYVPKIQAIFGNAKDSDPIKKPIKQPQTTAKATTTAQQPKTAPQASKPTAQTPKQQPTRGPSGKFAPRTTP